MPKKEGNLTAAPSAAGPDGGISALKVPANLLAAAFARNQVPIINEDNLRGANFETIESPIGDRHNSPMV